MWRRPGSLSAKGRWQPTEGPAPGAMDGMPWLQGFRGQLVAPATCAFVDRVASAAGTTGVLDRSRFEPPDLKPWRGDLSILQWDAAVGDYRYRLFGSNWLSAMGRDLTGLHLSAWPHKVARAIRDRVRTVVVRRVPVGARIVVAQSIGGRVERGHAVFEEVMWPLRYGPGPVAAVLALSVRVPDDAGLNADTLLAATGRHGVWFSADGKPLTPSPVAAATAGPYDWRHERLNPGRRYRSSDGEFPHT